jgi:transposase
MELTETEFIISKNRSKGQPYDKRLIAQIVELEAQGVPRRDLIKAYGMSSSTLLEWLRGSGSSPSKRRSYTQSEKRSVMRGVDGGMSIREAQIAYNISHPSIIRHWIKKNKEENAELSLFKPVEVAKNIPTDSSNTELEALQKALAEANLKIQALDTLIDIAEEQLKIDIRKKSGARQSSK